MTKPRATKSSVTKPTVTKPPVAKPSVAKPASKPAVLQQKLSMHARNRHRAGYDFEALVVAHPGLKKYVRPNPSGVSTIDFANPAAVKALNQTLLKLYYEVEHWDIPAQFLCPPIPGRVDYLHYLADLLAAAGHDDQREVRVLDIGTGANLVYPLLGQYEYGWQFVGVDINPAAIANAQRIMDANPSLQPHISLRHQPDEQAIFDGIIQRGDQFTLSMCNPPFHGSLQEAQTGARRKLSGLARNTEQKARVKGLAKNHAQPKLNFGGQSAELYCDGGEVGFITRMVQESARYAQQCLWFTTLVSKAESLPAVKRALKQVPVRQVEVIEMAQGQKQSRIVAWSFVETAQRKP